MPATFLHERMFKHMEVVRVQSILPRVHACNNVIRGAEPRQVESRIVENHVEGNEHATGSEPRVSLRTFSGIFYENEDSFVQCFRAPLENTEFFFFDTRDDDDDDDDR